jgi:xylan 1,4-beta-xylosidase
MAFLVFSLCFIMTARSQNNSKIIADGFYVNSIFAGYSPDPSILWEGQDYYVVYLSFEYYPGFTIWHSQDLINWRPETNALHKYVGSIWAADLLKYNDNYYIYFPANNTNYVITARSIAA